jgi:hypothetical protein
MAGQRRRRRLTPAQTTSTNRTAKISSLIMCRA